MVQRFANIHCTHLLSLTRIYTHICTPDTHAHTLLANLFVPTHAHASCCPLRPRALPPSLPPSLTLGRSVGRSLARAQYGDGFPHGSPEGSDPLVLARQMAQAGISLFMVACEPALSSYSHAADFYQGIVRITSGLLVPLTTASLLTHVIIAAASEAMALDRLHRQVGDEVAERLRTLSLEGNASQETTTTDPNSLMDEVARDLHQRLLLRNESTKQLVIETIYRESPESQSNIDVWSTARDLASAKPLIQKVGAAADVIAASHFHTRNAISSTHTHTRTFIRAPAGPRITPVRQLPPDPPGKVHIHDGRALPWLLLLTHPCLTLRVRVMDHRRRRRRRRGRKYKIQFQRQYAHAHRHQRLFHIHRCHGSQRRVPAQQQQRRWQLWRQRPTGPWR